MGCGDVRLLRTIRGVDFTGQDPAALNKLTMPSLGLAVSTLRRANIWLLRSGTATIDIPAKIAQQRAGKTEIQAEKQLAARAPVSTSGSTVRPPLMRHGSP